MRMLFDVATPMLMMAPMSAGTESVVPVAKSIQTIPAMAPGRAMRMISGSSQDWKLTTMSRYTRSTAAMIPSDSPRKLAFMLWT